MVDVTDAKCWSTMVDAASPASLLVVIESRLGPDLRRALTPEDIWQESLLAAWRDRAACRATDARGFRLWLVSVIDNRIREAADERAALKRGGPGINAGGRTGSGAGVEESAKQLPRRVHMVQVSESDAAGTVTPSRLASFREQAAIMREALEGLGEDVRDVVRLRLFEQMTIEGIAARLGIGGSAVRHRFRRGIECYHRLLRSALATRGATMMPADAALGMSISSPPDARPRPEP